MGEHREGSRDVGDGIIVSMMPDVCLTPSGGGMVPVPYSIWARQQDVANMADTVRQTNLRSHVRDSLVLRCYGDEAGTGGGVLSGTTGSVCTPKTWSSSVRFEERNAVRHEDLWWMNDRNTFGRLIYTKDLSSYPTPAPETVEPLLDDGRGPAAAGVDSPPGGAGAKGADADG